MITVIILNVNTTDGKCPDGITLAPWKCGQLLVWDATCPDIYAPSYSSIAIAVANQAERKKQQNYSHQGPGHIFTPIAIESSCVFGTETLKFVKDLGHCLKLASKENSAFSSCTTWRCCIWYGFFGLRADGGLFVSICD